jgi:uncharacterized membrane protein
MSALEIPASPLSLPTLLPVRAAVRLPASGGQITPRQRRPLQVDAMSTNPQDLRKVCKVSASRRLEKLAYHFCSGFASASNVLTSTRTLR